MQLEWVIFASLLAIGSSTIVRERSVRALGDEMCKRITLGGVRCVTRTKFVLPFQDPERDDPSECPAGTVCADVEEVCSAREEPACSNEAMGVQGVCNTCPTEIEYNPVCVSSTEYAFCKDEVIASNMKYKCPISKPYCKAEFNKNYSLKSICTAEPNATDCAPNMGYSDKTPLPTGQCTEDGWFADYSDKDCRSYFRCLARSDGTYMKIDFKCVTLSSIFHPQFKRCVADGSYVCPGTAVV